MDISALYDEPATSLCELSGGPMDGTTRSLPNDHGLPPENLLLPLPMEPIAVAMTAVAGMFFPLCSPRVRYQRAYVCEDTRHWVYRFTC